MTVYKSTIQLLRIPFSINLLPIFLFAIHAASGKVDSIKSFGVFLLIHFVFYPASNAYNSYMDRDTGSIAGIENPPAPTRQLYKASIVLDLLGLALSLLISLPFFLLNLLLVLLSRSYSYRGIRLKMYAIPAFLMVALAQGGISFYNMYLGIQGLDYFPGISKEVGLQILCASLFVGAIYPITQIYQHDEDRLNGDNTISMLLGIRGSLLFSGLLFILSNVLLYFVLLDLDFIIFEVCMLPAVFFFIIWTIKVWKDENQANFRNTMIMALSASICMICGFALILYLNY